MYFAELTENAIDPDDLGIYALAAVPVGETVADVPEAYIYDWIGSFDFGTGAAPGIYFPDDVKG